MRLVKTGFKDCAEVVVLYAREGVIIDHDVIEILPLVRF